MSVAHELRGPTGERICVLIDGIEEYLFMGGGDGEELLLSFLGDLSADNMRFILSSRFDWIEERLSGLMRGVQVFRIGALSREGAARMLEHLMRDWKEKPDLGLIEELIVRSKGSPFILHLMVQTLKEGTSFEELRQAMDTSLSSLLQRVHRRLLEAGVPDILLRAIARRLTDEEHLDWNKLQRELNVTSSVVATLEQSSLFFVETDGNRSLLRVSHAQVLDFLRAQYNE